MADPFVLLLQGDIINAIINVFTNVMGLWFWALMIFGFEITLWLKSQNFTLVGVTSIILISPLSALIVTPALSFAIIAIALISAAILYKVFH